MLSSEIPANRLRYKFKPYANYYILPKRRGKEEIRHVFRYCGKKGVHHVFREVKCGWTRTYTDAQLIGKEVRRVES